MPPTIAPIAVLALETLYCFVCHTLPRLFRLTAVLEAEKDPANAPTIVWYNGGPGAASMFGLWVELGPYYLNQVRFAGRTHWLSRVHCTHTSWLGERSPETPCEWASRLVGRGERGEG